MTRNVEQWPDGSRHNWDGAAGTYTQTDPDGATVISRALTAEEAAVYPPTSQPDVPDPLTALQAQVDALTDIVLGGTT